MSAFAVGASQEQNEAATAIMTSDTIAPDQGVVNLPKAGDVKNTHPGKWVGLAFLGLVIVIGALGSRSDVAPYVSAEDLSKTAAEKVCNFPPEAITLVSSADNTTDSTPYTHTEIFYVTPNGSHQVIVTTDISAVDGSGIAGTSHLNSCG